MSFFIYIRYQDRVSQEYFSTYIMNTNEVVVDLVY